MELPQQILNECIWSIASHTSNDYTCAPAMPPRVRSPSAAKPPPSIVVARTSLTFVCCWMGICSIPTSCPQPTSNSLLQNHLWHSTAIDAVSRKILTLRAKQNTVFLTTQGTVRRDLVKVNDPSLKKAPPDALEFGSDGASCQAST